ncbi:MAG: hypothetical protein ACOX3R_04270 [Desulfitobacteriia bacterium]|jgi:hypothetical protein
MLGKDRQTKGLLGVRGPNAEGYVSLLLLLVLIFLSWIGSEALWKSGSEERIVRYEAQRMKASYLADSGLEWARSELVKDPFWRGGVKVFRSGRVEVDVSASEEEYTIISRSACDQAVQGRSAVLGFDENGVLVLFKYGELFY